MSKASKTKETRAIKASGDASLIALHLEHREFQKHITRKTAQARFDKMEKSAVDEGITLGISFKNYRKLISKPCNYCGGKLSDTGYGLDRLDATKGYEWKNLVPCCTSCNTIKLDTHTPRETLVMVQALKEERLKNPNAKRANSRRCGPNFPLQTLEREERPKIPKKFHYITIEIDTPLKLNRVRKKLDLYILNLKKLGHVNRAFLLRKDILCIETEFYTFNQVLYDLKTHYSGVSANVRLLSRNPLDRIPEVHKIQSTTARTQLHQGLDYTDTDKGRHYVLNPHPKLLERHANISLQPSDLTLYLDKTDIPLEFEYEIVTIKIIEKALRK